MDLNRLFAENTRRIRRASGLTIKHLAANAGVGTTTVWLIENNQHNASLKVVQQIADALGVKPATLLRQRKVDDQIVA